MEDITYEFLLCNGKKIGSELEGTIILYEYNGIEYSVLQDNSVILKSEWDKE
jgi:hypothetical protein